MLGIAARISIRKLNGVLTDFGAISERNTATPILTGKERINARREETMVPKINGNAPNSSVTGFQFEEKINPKPNISLLCFESTNIS